MAVNMASIEVQLLWHGHATAVTHSQEWVGGEGIQYDLVLAQLAANPNMTADQVAIATSQSATNDKTWSAVAVDSRFNAFLTAVNQLVRCVEQVVWPRTARNMIKPLAQRGPSGRRRWIRICMIWHIEIKRNVTDTTIKNKSQAVMNAVNAVVLHERHVNAYADVHGITIYHISKRRKRI